jgi:hypothetical protein
VLGPDRRSAPPNGVAKRPGRAKRAARAWVDEGSLRDRVDLCAEGAEQRVDATGVKGFEPLHVDFKDQRRTSWLYSMAAMAPLLGGAIGFAKAPRSGARLAPKHLPHYMAQIATRQGNLLAAYFSAFLALWAKAASAREARNGPLFANWFAPSGRRAEGKSISNKIRPALTPQAQNSGAPFPLPIRTSAGFVLTGISGNTLNHTRPWPPASRPPCPIFDRIIFLHASICAAVIRADSIAFSAYVPNATSAPILVGLSDTRPLWFFLNFLFFGLNISLVAPHC